MIKKWFKRREPQVDPVDISKQAEESLQITREQQAHVNYLTSWLNNRQGKNGFGEDFEVTFNPRRAS